MDTLAKILNLITQAVALAAAVCRLMKELGILRHDKPEE